MPRTGRRSGIGRVADCAAICAALLLTPTAGLAQNVVWRTDYAAAKRLATSTGKPFLVDFSAVWCGPCQQMEKTTFHDARVRKLLAGCVCVHVDIDKNASLAQRFGVNSIPRIFVTSAHGKRVMDALGYRDSDSFRTDLAAALSGKSVIEAQEGPKESPDVAAIRARVEKNSYAAWAKEKPVAAQRGRAALVEQLGSFEQAEREQASDILSQIGEDAIPSLIAGLASHTLAIRAGAYDTLNRLMTDRFHVPAAAQPRYDPWARGPERAVMAAAWRRWWAGRTNATRAM